MYQGIYLSPNSFRFRKQNRTKQNKVSSDLKGNKVKRIKVSGSVGVSLNFVHCGLKVSKDKGVQKCGHVSLPNEEMAWDSPLVLSGPLVGKC